MKEIFQKEIKTEGETTICHTATMITALSVAFGIQNSALVRKKMDASTAADVTIPDKGDLTPDSELTAVRDAAPPTAMPPKKLLARFATPRKVNSWFAEIV